MAKQTELEIVRPLKPNSACNRCPLSKSSLTVCCPSGGPKQADIAIWGETLSATEENRGKPFLGDSGRKLNYLLRQAKLSRKNLRIALTVRCKPPGAKKPSKKEVDACWPYSLYDILAGKPKVIVSMGALATKQLLGDPSSLKKVRGFPVQKTFYYAGKKGSIEHTCWIIPTYHPNMCLHDWSNDDIVVFDLLNAKKIADGLEPLVWPDTKIEVAKTFDQAMQLIQRLKRSGEWVFDTETTGFDPHEAKILCIGFCMKAGTSHILPFYSQGMVRFWKPNEEHQIVEALAEAFQESALIGQNLKFDIKQIRKMTGLVDYEIAHDTLIGHRCIDENKPHNLTFQCQWYLKWAKYDALMDKYKVSKKEFRTWEVPDELLWKYCAYDCDGTFRLAEAQKPELEEAKALTAFHTEMDLIVPLADVEYRGFQTNKDKLFELSIQYRKQADAAKKKLCRSASKLVSEEFGEKFNPNSTQQLIVLLKASGANLRKKTKGGNPSVDRLVLSKLALESNKAGTIAKNVQLLRKATKYVGTYLDGSDGKGGLLQHIKSHDRVHPTYNLGLTRTGRLSADDPPIQTIPRMGGLRTIFVPDNPAKHKLIAVDYAKLELCIMAWLANDDKMCTELINQVDLHTRMALTVRLNRDPTDEEFEELSSKVGKDERALAKGVNFGIPYGRGASAIVEANPEAFPKGMIKPQRVNTVQAIIEAYYNKYWGVHDYLEAEVERGKNQGYLLTPFFKRRRNIFAAMKWFNSDESLSTEHRDYDLSHVERELRNFRIQSLGSDLLSRATKKAWEGMKGIKIPAFRIVLSLHDALIFNCHEDYIDDALPHIKDWMEVILPKSKKHKYEMPIRVDPIIHTTWGDEFGD